ncbi:hypothetical protein D3C77_339620 [compost metagenome]
MPDMHAVTRRVNPTVQGNCLLLGQLAESLRIRLLINGLAPFQFINNIQPVQLPIFHKIKNRPLVYIRLQGRLN